MAEFTVTASEVNKKAAELQALNRKYLEAVQELEKEVDGLSGKWEGEAYTAFHNSFVKDSKQMYNFYNAIEQYCVTLSEIAVNYSESETRNVTTASGTQG